MPDIEKFCDKHDACRDGREWALANCKDMSEAWEKLPPEWLVWVATRPGVLPDDMLREFARWCALQVIGVWGAPDIVREYLTSGHESLRDAAWAAAMDAAMDAARDAAMDSYHAASAAASAASAASVASAAASAARVARDAAIAAASAARDAWVASVDAWDDAYDAAWDERAAWLREHCGNPFERVVQPN